MYECIIGASVYRGCMPLDLDLYNYAVADLVLHGHKGHVPPPLLAHEVGVA